MMKGSVIISDDVDKMVERKGVYFFFSGTTCDFESFMDCYFGAEATHLIDCNAFVFDNGKFFCTGVFDDEKRVYKDPVPLHITESIGSGQQFALAYMDTGMSAEEAIKATMKRDPYTGGEVKVFKFDDQKGFLDSEKGK